MEVFKIVWQGRSDVTRRRTERVMGAGPRRSVCAVGCRHVGVELPECRARDRQPGEGLRAAPSCQEV
jgi:hypothetical protein